MDIYNNIFLLDYKLEGIYMYINTHGSLIDVQIPPNECATYM